VWATPTYGTNGIRSTAEAKKKVKKKTRSYQKHEKRHEKPTTCAGVLSLAIM